MTTATHDLSTRSLHALRQAEAWLDGRGRGAWIAATIVGFVAFWPVGLALLGYAIVGGKLGSAGTTRRSARDSSGNAAFDAYRDETIRRLEEEQAAFQDFLRRLREAKDKAEFDQFMEDRKRGETVPATDDARRAA